MKNKEYYERRKSDFDKSMNEFFKRMKIYFELALIITIFIFISDITDNEDIIRFSASLISSLLIVDFIYLIVGVAVGIYYEDKIDEADKIDEK